MKAKKLIRALWLTPLLLAPLAGTCAAGDDAGALVLVGGELGVRNEPVYQEIVKRRIPGRPICVLGTGSAEPAMAARSQVSILRRYGGRRAAVSIELTHRQPERAYRRSMTRRLGRCGGFFFTGGDPSRIVDTFRPGGEMTPALGAMFDVLERGGVIAGSGAGAAMMSNPMIGAGSSRDALLHGVVSDEDRPGVWVREGMGFLREGLSDQRHLARGRFGRLLAALVNLPDVSRGFGIDEDTALIVTGREARVVGASRVAILEIETERIGDGPEAAATVRLFLVGDADTYDLDESRVTVDERKSALPPSPASLDPPGDPWDADALHRFLVRLARSTERGADLDLEGWRLRIGKGEGFAVHAWRAGDADELPGGLTAGPYELELYEAVPR